MSAMTFQTELKRLRRAWQTGLLLAGMVNLAAWALVFVGIYAVFDYFLALSATARWTLNAALLLGLFVVAGRQLIRISRIPESEAARRVDRILNDQRYGALSAWEMLQEKPAEEGSLHQFLAQHCVTEERRRLVNVDGTRMWPERGLRNAFIFLGCTLAVLFLLALGHFRATPVLLGRILVPALDIPPYSPYTFVVEPRTPRVYYGDTASVSVRISGAPVREQVWMRTRHGGVEFESAAFRETEERYTQRLENVVEPVEFAFGVGRARSRWHKIDLILEPRVAMAEFTLTPPAYTRLPTRQFMAGNESLRGYRNSKLRLMIASNRPLLDGRLLVRDETGLRPDQEIEGRLTGPHGLLFEWDLREDAELELTFRDLRGTSNSEEFKLRQEVIPDDAPRVSLSDPPPYQLATPNAVLEMAGFAEDDLGLARVELVHSLEGHRDYPLPMALEAGEKRFRFGTELTLGRLGVEPGEILEFYLEARDFNPSMMGVGSSDIVRVEIISEDDYAEMLRTRITVEAFNRRYHELQRALEAAREALQTLRDESGDLRTTPEQIGELVGQARESLAEAAEAFEAAAGEFAAFDMETDLHQTASEIGETLRAAEDHLGQLEDPYANANRTAQEVLNEIGETFEAMAAQRRLADEVSAVARAMELATDYQRFISWQRDLHRRLNRFSTPLPPEDAGPLRRQGERQEEIRAELSLWQLEMREVAGQLPETYALLAFDMEAFAAAIDQARIYPAMADAVRASVNEDGRQTRDQAGLALERMESLLDDREECTFAELGQGGIGFDVAEGMQQTLEQMLRAIQQRGGSGGPNGRIGSGGAGMIGGDPRDGQLTGGGSALDIPLAGPTRRMSSGGESGRGDGEGGSGPGALPERVAEREKMEVSDPDEVRGDARALEQVPERYREAVIRFFSED